MHPGEHLNIVIGPNGTGKSSMVAAIVIGMGGKTQVLSARLQLKDYIKNGQNEAKIEVVLFRNEARQLEKFSRTFGRDGKSQYTVSG